jgi:hypothetical protein
MSFFVIFYEESSSYIFMVEDSVEASSETIVITLATRLYIFTAHEENSINFYCHENCNFIFFSVLYDEVM